MFKTEFSQNDFGTTEKDGQCLAISGLWCKLIVQAGAYTSTSDRFFQWFDSKEVRKRQRLLTLSKLTKEIKDKQDAYSAHNANTAKQYLTKWAERKSYLMKTIHNQGMAKINEKYPTLPPEPELVLSEEEVATGFNWDRSRAAKGKPPVATLDDGKHLIAKRAMKSKILVKEAIEFGISNCGLTVTHGITVEWDSAVDHIGMEHGCYTISLVDAQSSKHTMAACFLATKDDEGNEFIIFDPNQYEIFCTRTELITLFSDLKKLYSAGSTLICRVINKAG